MIREQSDESMISSVSSLFERQAKRHDFTVHSRAESRDEVKPDKCVAEISGGKKEDAVTQQSRELFLRTKALKVLKYQFMAAASALMLSVALVLKEYFSSEDPAYTRTFIYLAWNVVILAFVVTNVPIAL